MGAEGSLRGFGLAMPLPFAHVFGDVDRSTPAGPTYPQPATEPKTPALRPRPACESRGSADRGDADADAESNSPRQSLWKPPGPAHGLSSGSGGRSQPARGAGQFIERCAFVGREHPEDLIELRAGPGRAPGWFACADEVLIHSTFRSRVLNWSRSVETSARCSTRRSIAGQCGVHSRTNRFRLNPRVGPDRIQAGGRELERVRLFGLGVATPNGPAALRFDFLRQTSGDQLRPNLLRCRAFQLRWNRWEAILALSRCAQKLTLLITKFQ